MAKDKLTEEEIADVIGYYLTCKGWDLYPEVDIPVFGGRPDYIGVKNKLSLCIECKKSLTYPVLEQLTRWQHEWVDATKSAKMYKRDIHLERQCIPHLLLAVTESPTSSRIARLKEDIIKGYRLGYYSVKLDSMWAWDKKENTPPMLCGKSWNLGGEDCPDGEQYRFYYKGKSWRVTEHIQPKIQYGSRRTAPKIIDLLQEDMKGFSAGTTGKGYMTEFKRTMLKVESILARGGVWHMDNIIQVMNKELGGHHYASDASAKSSIASLIEKLKYGTKVNRGYVSYIESDQVKEEKLDIDHILPTVKL